MKYLAYTHNGSYDHVLLVEETHGTPDETVTTSLDILSAWQVNEDVLRDYLRETGETIDDWVVQNGDGLSCNGRGACKISDYGELLAITTEIGTYEMSEDGAFQDRVKQKPMTWKSDLYENWTLLARASWRTPARQYD